MPRRRDSPLDADALRRLLDDQSGVVARSQLLSSPICADANDVRRLLGSRRLVAIVPGVYVAHTGPPTWLQRAWAGVLHAAPAALDRDSSLRAANGPGRRGRGDDEPIQIAIDSTRRISAPPGFVVRRVVALQEKALWNTGPPRLRSEHATLDAALRTKVRADRVEALARSVRSRQTTADRLLDAVAARSRVTDRRFVTQVLRDIRDGTASVLEHAYLTKVERAHRLPAGRRQVRELVNRRLVVRDVGYDVGLLVELDGRLDHLAGRERARDLSRDVEVALSGRQGVRLGWSQVFDQPCETARNIALLLRARGWSGTPTPCGPGCAVAAPD